MSDPFEELDATRTVLKDGLAAIDRIAREPGDPGEALGVILESLRGLGDPVALREGVGPSELERFDDGLEELVRLNAVLVAAIAAERGRMLEKLATVRRSRRDLGRLGSGSRRGVRCDVAGRGEGLRIALRAICL